MCAVKPETILQARIVRALKVAGYWVERIFAGEAPTRGGYIHGASDGTPDLLVIGKGWSGFGEVKLPGEELRDNQIEWHVKATDLGHNVAVWTCPADAIRSCELWRRKAAA